MSLIVQRWLFKLADDRELVVYAPTARGAERRLAKLAPGHAAIVSQRSAGVVGADGFLSIDPDATSRLIVDGRKVIA